MRIRYKLALSALSFTLCLVVADYLVGLVADISHIRSESRQYAQETLPLPFHTRILRSGVFHEYEEPYRPEGERYFTTSERRLFRTDASGFILGTNVSSVQKQDTLVVFIGDSVTESQEVDEPCRFPALVETFLHREGLRHIRTLNYGVRGHTTQDSLNLLLNHAGIRRANVLAIMFNVNDRDFLSERQDYFAPTRHAAAANSSHSSLRSRVWDWLRLRSNMAFLLASKLDRRQEQQCMRAPAAYYPRSSQSFWETRSAEHFRTNLLLLLAMCRTLGIRPVLMTQALAENPDVHRWFNEIVVEVSLTAGVDLIDLESHFPAERSTLFFPDKIHLNNEGSIQTAQIIARYLAPLLKAQEQQSGCSPASAAVSARPSAPDHPESQAPSLARASPVLSRVILPGPYRYPSLSPDQKWLLFMETAERTSRVWIQNTGSGDKIRLSPESGVYMHPVFLDATRILCTRETSRGLDLVTFAYPTISEPCLLDTSIAVSAHIPDCARDACALVFAGTLDKKPIPNLYLYDFAAKNLWQLTETPWEEWRPVFSPDAKTLFFIANPANQFDIFRLSLGPEASAKPEPVYQSAWDEWDPCISPDGTRLVFATKELGNWDLMMLKLRTGEAKRLSDSPDDEYDPRFHPSGKTLLFAVGPGKQQGIHEMPVQ